MFYFFIIILTYVEPFSEQRLFPFFPDGANLKERNALTGILQQVKFMVLYKIGSFLLRHKLALNPSLSPTGKLIPVVYKIWSRIIIIVIIEIVLS